MPMGQPAKYKTPQELRVAVDAYFVRCAGTLELNDDGIPVARGAVPPTMSGLSYWLGFKDRRQFTMQKYRSPEFADVVSYGKLRVEQYNEERLFDPDGFRGATFMLRTCFGWGKENTPEVTEVRIVTQEPGKAGAEKRTPESVGEYKLCLTELMN